MHIALLGPSSPRDLADLLNVTAPLPLGLGGTPVNLLARGLAGQGHSVDLITCLPDIDERMTFEGDHLRILGVPWRSRPRDRARDFFAAERRLLHQQLSRSGADLAHAHWTYEYALAATKSPVPTVVTIHDAPLTILRHHRDLYRLIRFGMAARVRAANPCLTAVSPYVRDAWKSQLIHHADIPVIPNIAHSPAPNDPLSPPVVACIGSADPLKNVQVALRSFASIRSSHPELELWLVGPGLDAGSDFAQSARLKGLDEAVRFIGPVPPSDVPPVLRKATVLLHPSLEEAQSMLLNEALAAGVPVIAGAESGGVPWSLDFGKAGVLVDVRSVDAVSQALDKILGN